MKLGGKWRYPAALGIALVACTAAQEQEAPRDIGSDSLAAAVMIDITELDQTFQIYPSYATEHNFTGAVLPGYEARRILLRRQVAVPLARAQDDLKSDGLGLRVFDGYRPVRATLAMVDWAEASGRVDLLDDGYIARRSRHNLGVAVDLTLIDLETGRALDMGTPYDTFTEDAHTMNATGEILERRLRLKEALEAVGFQNYGKEWWHYSFPLDDAVAFDLVIGEE
ncbi:MAG: M15 family metallopeptidase [Gemmatimonadales bacterium]